MVPQMLSPLDRRWSVWVKTPEVPSCFWPENWPMKNGNQQKHTKLGNVTPPTCNSPKRRFLLGGPYWTVQGKSYTQLLQGKRAQPNTKCFWQPSISLLTFWMLHTKCFTAGRWPIWMFNTPVFWILTFWRHYFNHDRCGIVFLWLTRRFLSHVRSKFFRQLTLPL